MPEAAQYNFTHSRPGIVVSKLMPTVRKMVGEVKPGSRVLDVGCGNGSQVSHLVPDGCTVVGIDPSESGIANARKGYPQHRFENMLATPGMLDELGEEPFDIIISTEVVEHVYAPRDWATGVFRALKPGGRLVCTTPFHGYVKNVLISATGKWDHHHKPLWDGGHIKFWSPQNLEELLREAGFSDVEWKGAGRFWPVWMSMVMRGIRPAA
ncbi:class I SAM-dependent methyltransferase [Planctomycetaceae bacterium AH-315-I19]|nr:class I SAM-dependent methyltransferase [Planctomycetaceae bacterium AH-315-I19]